MQNENVKLMPVDHDSCFDKLLDYVPDLMQKVNEMFNKNIKQKEEKNKKIINEIKNKKSYEDKEKSEQVKEQEQKVKENEEMAEFKDVSEIIESDGEIF